jgi:hypothetical protein
VYDEVQSSDPVAIVKQEDLAGTTEYAVEYSKYSLIKNDLCMESNKVAEFPETKSLSERRPFFEMIGRQVLTRVFFFPWITHNVFYISSWSSICFTLFLWNMSLTLALAFLCIVLARLMLFTFEFTFLSKRDLREAEFEEWYSELHEDTIALDRTTVSLITGRQSLVAP